MRKGHKTFGDRLILWAARRSEVGRFDGIRLADDKKRESFKRTIEQALGLIRDHDPRRYARVTRYIHWIVNGATPSRGMEYNDRIHLCMVEFLEIPGLDQDALAAFYACCLVHESAHGVVDSHEITYAPENRVRIERLCVTEQNRFASRLAAADRARYPIELLHVDFQESWWEEAWTGSRLKTALSLLRRAMSGRSAELRVPPNGGPATRSGDSGVTERPPSVS
jgi:hypothetical protein